MSANNSSDVNALGNNTPPLLSLPAELVDMVAQALDKPADLLSLRSTCRQLRNASSREYCKRFFNRIEISGTSSSVRDLTDILLSPNLPSAKHLARSLQTTAPRVYPKWPVDVNHLRERLCPSPEDVARLFAVMPKLNDVSLRDWNGSEENPFQQLAVVQSAPVLLKALATPGPCLPRLRRLMLMHVFVSVLEQHKHSLEIVWLCSVRTSGTASWVEVLKSLLSTDVSSFRLSFVESVDENGNGMHVVFPVKAQVAARGPGSHHLASEGHVWVDKKHVKPVLEIILQTWGNSVWLEEGTWF